MAKKEVATRIGGSQAARVNQVLNGALPELPAELSGTVNLRGWIASVFTGADYTQPDPDYLSREIGLNILMGDGDILSADALELPHLQDIVEDYPGATTGPIRIQDLYVVPSDLDEGSATYMILTWTNLETNETVRCSGGSQPVQVRLIRCLMAGMWPIECQIARDKSKDKGGRFLLTVWPVDA